MDEEAEVANLIGSWLTRNAPEWRINWGLEEHDRPRIERWTGQFNPISHLISGHRVIIDYRYPQSGITGIELNVSDPEFFNKLKVILKKCEETFNY